MALFGFGKDKKDSGDLELVLAYLEDAQRVRAPFQLVDKRHTDIQAILQGVDEGGSLLTFQVQGGAFEKGAKLEFLFMQENLRIGGTTRVQDVRGNIVVAELPEILELCERRKTARARLNPKEGASVTALTSLFEGVGVNGILENLSEGGCRVRVEKALNIKDERRLPLGRALLPIGQPFMLLKLNKVPKCPAVMEMAGRVVYLDDTAGGLSIGIEFDKPKAELLSAIRGMVSSRSAAIPSSIPPKSRRRPAASEASSLGGGAERTPRPPAPKPAVQEPPAQEAKPAPAEVTPAEPAGGPQEAPPPREGEPQPEPEAAPVPPRNLALLRLKKRTRGVVVFATAAYGQLLKQFLLEDGYGRVFTTSSQEELPGLLRQPNVGLVFIDAEMPVLECLELVSQLHETEPDLPPVVVAAQEVSRALVLAAHRSGISQLVVKPYSLDETFSSLLEQLMGL
ncbi:MAG TPA: response regulator [Holophaga sp.]|nr:response regulator [Holophaga sp.]